MIVILGGGLAGLATARFLGDAPHVVLEADDLPGGLCRTRPVGGFLFDYTGHLLHLRDPRIVSTVEEMLPGAFEVIERRAVIRTRGATLPFPFQANLHGLPKEVVLECIVGAAEALAAGVPDDPAISFRDWSLAVLGKGISEAFMFPYNSTFRYPREGGIGVLPAAFARGLSNLRTGERVVAVDLDRRVVRTASGRAFPFRSLVNTLPLPGFLRMLEGGPAAELGPLAETLDWSVVGCLNLGIGREGVAEGIHWCYFPDADAPFYRVGFPHNISPSTCPPGTSSLYVEFGLRREEAPDPAKLEEASLAALEREGFLRPGDVVVAREWVTIDPGYVIFDRARQEAMRRVIPALRELGIDAIGRYGAWTYSYMERAMLDGLVTAERLRGA